VVDEQELYGISEIGPSQCILDCGTRLLLWYELKSRRSGVIYTFQILLAKLNSRSGIVLNFNIAS